MLCESCARELRKIRLAVNIRERRMSDIAHDLCDEVDKVTDEVQDLRHW
jgi:hypothetical protein